MPIDYSKYPPNWKTEIRPAVLKRANNCCEVCGVKNYAIGYRVSSGEFIEVTDEQANDLLFRIDKNIFKIVLTVAHLDHDETNQEIKIERLMAMCQRDHLRYDAQEKVKRRKKSYEQK